MDSIEIYQGVRRLFSNHDHLLENLFVHRWEADVFSVTSSKYSYETEVKVSRSDFFADFKKQKHHFFNTLKKGYGIYRGDHWEYTQHLGYNNPELIKHPELNGFKVESTRIEPYKYGYTNAPNKFWYAVPYDMIKIEEIPHYAGLLYCRKDFLPVIIKQAPFIHKEKFNDKEMLFDKYYWLWRNHKHEIMKLREQVEDLQLTLKER